MSVKNRYSFDEERFVAFLQDAVSKVKTEEDPVALTEMKKLFKKNVPFSLRMYVAAYLSKLVSLEGRGYYRSRRDSYHRNSMERNFHKEKTSNEYRSHRMENSEKSDVRTPSRRVSIDEDLAATIFISIGRKRRVFPRDLVGLMIQVAGLERERIGDIRTLENYSFVQIFKEDAEKVISALDGYMYRGRKLSVSYSRKKDELDESNTYGDFIESNDIQEKNNENTMESLNVEENSIVE